MSERVLVIGGTRGAGLLIARRLLCGGDRVRVLARDVERARSELGSAIEIVPGDITKPESLPAAVDGSDHIIFTAGVRSARYAPERLVKLTDYDGVLNTLAAARSTRFVGRFVYLNPLGVKTWSLSRALINLMKEIRTFGGCVLSLKYVRAASTTRSYVLDSSWITQAASTR